MARWNKSIVRTISIGERFRSGFGRDGDDEFVIAD
jgi:hypothetical protein